MKMRFKQCGNCKKRKSIVDFYKHKLTKDGYFNTCKTCIRGYSKKRYDLLAEDIRALRRENYSKHGYLNRNRINEELNLAKYKNRYPEKQLAHKAAVRSVKIEFVGAHRHHWSYNEAHYKDVIQLSARHHAKAHRFFDL